MGTEGFGRQISASAQSLLAKVEAEKEDHVLVDRRALKRLLETIDVFGEMVGIVLKETPGAEEEAA